MTFYRKYRPQTFAQLLGQAQVTVPVSRAIAAGQPAHAYLFAGPKGTGKTSVARIIAKSLNCLDRKDGTADPCNTCANCQAIDKGAFLDVIEVDAASKTKVEDMRELIEQVAFAPVMGKYKVYILDEAHMLSNSSFNALLKTLEEPPAKTLFILCTTESHKVPVTIVSRCQRLSFTRATVAQLVEQLEIVAKAEKITIEPSALQLVASLADGGYRDAEMLLEQLSTAEIDGKKGQTVTRQQVEEQLGVASHQVTDQILLHIAEKKSGQLLKSIEEFAGQGGNIRQLADALLDQCRWLLLATVSPELLQDKSQEDQQNLLKLAKLFDQKQVLDLSQHLLEVRQKLQHYQGVHQSLALQTALLGALQTATWPTVRGEGSEKPISTPTVSLKSDKQPTQASKSEAPTPKTPRTPAIPDPDAATEVETEAVESTPTPPASPLVPPPAELTAVWSKVLDIVRPQSRSVEALLRDCLPLSFDGTILVLQFWYEFHKKKLEMDKNRVMVEEAVSQIVGSSVKIQCQLGDKNAKPKRRPMAEEDIKNVEQVEEENLLEAAVDIFGGEIID